MKSYLVTLLFACTVCVSQAQNEQSDSLRLIETMAWLEKSLTFNYYNPEDKEWWVNRFTYNRTNKTVTMKHMAGPHPNAVSDKTYLQHDFSLQEMNPYTLQSVETPEHAGRMVVGKTIRLGAYHFNKAVKRTKNGRLSTDQSVLYLVIPKNLEDSSGGFSQTIKERLEEAILLSTKLYPTTNTTSSARRIQEMLPDQYIADGVVWRIEEALPGLLALEIMDGNKELQAKGFLRFAQNGGLELTFVRPNEPAQVLQLTSSTDNTYWYNGPKGSIRFKNRNEFTVSLQGKELDFVRDWSYDGDAPKYR